MTITVDIADCAVSQDPNVVLAAHSLGSGIGLTLWDPETKVGGLLHFVLPDSGVAPNQATRTPSLFCDTGVPQLFRAAYELGAAKSRLIIKVIGGAQLLDDDGPFQFGKRNYLALRKIFFKNSVVVAAEHVGGADSRSVSLAIANGEVSVRVGSQEVHLQ